MQEKIKKMFDSRMALVRALTPLLGFMAIVFGLAIMLLSIMIIYKQFLHYGAIDAKPLLIVSALLVLAVYLSISGFRMIFYRKDRTDPKQSDRALNDSFTL